MERILMVRASPSFRMSPLLNQAILGVIIRPRQLRLPEDKERLRLLEARELRLLEEQRLPGEAKRRSHRDLVAKEQYHLEVKECL